MAKRPDIVMISTNVPMFSTSASSPRDRNALVLPFQLRENIAFRHAFQFEGPRSPARAKRRAKIR
jgi:hypothetical protein